jgi:hypothetical protein
MNTPSRLPKLLLVYNAENGVFNALADTLHKVFSPATYQCTLCQYTHGLTGMVLPWKNFLDSLGLPSRFLYRSEFREQFPAFNEPLPLILLEYPDRLVGLLDAQTIHRTGGVDELMHVVANRLAAAIPAGLRCSEATPSPGLGINALGSGT